MAGYAITVTFFGRFHIGELAADAPLRFPVQSEKRSPKFTPMYPDTILSYIRVMTATPKCRQLDGFLYKKYNKQSQ